ncbi:E3 ubiquitin-protein ligase MARCHF4-like isoform X2 [Aricia agestis]|uniref:E3 ubiquitin-protein ligase MARCHF4-like isoform X2 n=1 Tax=Aricia agestis TaxID=91739 RepID=UPI001C208B78|nr:E3 ubiquitin-protein ligase MARCHF4-like isoform X2 [Aricia agestis]
MPIMRRRKFVAQNEICAKEINNIVLPSRQHGVSDLKKNKLTHNLYDKPTESTASVLHILHINKTTSTIEDSERINISVKEKQSQIKTTPKFLKLKSRHHFDQKHYDEIPLMHKIKVRNSKHKSLTFGDSSKQQKAAATSASIDQEEIEDQSIKINKSEEQAPRTSRAVMCRICHGGDSISEFGQLVSACSCKGTIGKVHVACLETWLTESGKSRCELCSMSYAIRRVHKYGILRALAIWLLSQNSKQVCYYCWIVSAATRHAIGWWIWYQSQYEVKLQLQNLRTDDDRYTSENIMCI